MHFWTKTGTSEEKQKHAKKEKDSNGEVMCDRNSCTVNLHFYASLKALKRLEKIGKRHHLDSHKPLPKICGGTCINSPSILEEESV